MRGLGNYHHNNTPLQAPGLLTLEVAEEVLQAMHGTGGVCLHSCPCGVPMCCPGGPLRSRLWWGWRWKEGK